uniref:Uncharacterized protein n=1 Tax=Ciona savignyi TaxID=51511 RepID=H2Y813_CIOSA
MSETNVRNRKPQTSLGSRTPNVSIDQKPTEQSNRWKIKVALTTVLCALLCVYGYHSSPINAVEITGVVEVPFEGPFALNKKLSKGKRNKICLELLDCQDPSQ